MLKEGRLLHLILLLIKGGLGGRFWEEHVKFKIELATLTKELKDRTEAKSKLPLMDVSSASASIFELKQQIQSKNVQIDTSHYTTKTSAGKSLGGQVGGRGGYIKISIKKDTLEHLIALAEELEKHGDDNDGTRAMAILSIKKDLNTQRKEDGVWYHTLEAGTTDQETGK